ncbi:unnamed protein product, partial [Phaeothamnion confervicola]
PPPAKSRKAATSTMFKLDHPLLHRVPSTASGLSIVFAFRDSSGGSAVSNSGGGGGGSDDGAATRRLFEEFEALSDRLYATRGSLYGIRLGCTGDVGAPGSFAAARGLSFPVYDDPTDQLMLQLTAILGLDWSRVASSDVPRTPPLVPRSPHGATDFAAAVVYDGRVVYQWSPEDSSAAASAAAATAASALDIPVTAPAATAAAADIFYDVPAAAVAAAAPISGCSLDAAAFAATCAVPAGFDLRSGFNTSSWGRLGPGGSGCHSACSVHNDDYSIDEDGCRRGRAGNDNGGVDGGSEAGSHESGAWRDTWTAGAGIGLPQEKAGAEDDAVAGGCCDDDVSGVDIGSEAGNAHDGFGENSEDDNIFSSDDKEEDADWTAPASPAEEADNGDAAIFAAAAATAAAAAATTTIAAASAAADARAAAAAVAAVANVPSPTPATAPVLASTPVGPTAAAPLSYRTGVLWAAVRMVIATTTKDGRFSGGAGDGPLPPLKTSAKESKLQPAAAIKKTPTAIRKGNSAGMRKVGGGLSQKDISLGNSLGSKASAGGSHGAVGGKGHHHRPAHSGFGGGCDGYAGVDAAQDRTYDGDVEEAETTWEDSNHRGAFRACGRTGSSGNRDRSGNGLFGGARGRSSSSGGLMGGGGGAVGSGGARGRSS